MRPSSLWLREFFNAQLFEIFLVHNKHGYSQIPNCCDSLCLQFWGSKDFKCLRSQKKDLRV